MDGPLMHYSAFNRERIPDRPFRCGFEPERHTFAEYVRHISVCPNLECYRRLVAHRELYRELTGHEWDERQAVSY